MLYSEMFDTIVSIVGGRSQSGLSRCVRGSTYLEMWSAAIQVVSICKDRARCVCMFKIELLICR